MSSNGSLLKARYESRVKWDLMQGYPEVRSPGQLASLCSVQLHWSRREVGMGSEPLSGAWTVLSLLSGCEKLPSIHRSRVSVASFRLREGEVTGVSMKLSGPVVWDFMDGFLLRVVPRFRPFDGFSTACVDDGGSLTCSIPNALMFEQIESYYELFNPRSSRSGFTVTVQSFDSDELASGLDRRSIAIDRYSGLGVPLIVG